MKFTGEENQLREEEKSDFQLISVDGRVVPEYMRNINPLCSAGVNDLVDQCSSTTLQNDQQSDGTQTASSMSKVESCAFLVHLPSCFEGSILLSYFTSWYPD